MPWPPPKLLTNLTNSWRQISGREPASSRLDGRSARDERIDVRHVPVHERLPGVLTRVRRRPPQPRPRRREPGRPPRLAGALGPDVAVAPPAVPGRLPERQDPRPAGLPAVARPHHKGPPPPPAPRPRGGPATARPAPRPPAASRRRRSRRAGSAAVPVRPASRWRAVPRTRRGT